MSSCAATSGSSSSSGSAAAGATPRKNEVLALDFDGVVCASSGESSYTSILAACDFWPRDIAIVPNSRPFLQIKDAVHALRPIVETGYENMLLVRLLYHRLNEKIDATGREATLDVRELMKSWSPAMRDALLLEYGSDKATMVRAFGAARDALIAKDIGFWVRLNEVYPWARLAMANLATTSRALDYTIVTTKQARFVQAILTQNDILPPPPDRLFDLENPFGSKTAVLQAILRGLPATSTLSASDLQAIPLLEPSRRPFIHFVEDRVETLLAILESGSELRNNTKLYLVEHGYNTPEQRELGRKYGDITLLSPNDFQLLLQNGPWATTRS